MKFKHILFVAIVCSVALTLGVSASASACEPRSDADPSCVMPRPKPRVVAVARVAPTAAPTPAPVKVAAVTNRGLSPADALALDSGWQIVPANSFMWYKNDYGNNFYSRVFLDTKTHDAAVLHELVLSVFSPEQINELSPSLKPKGNGYALKDEHAHDLVWIGKHVFGVWYFMVTNRNSFPVEHQVGFSDTGGDDRDCGNWYTETDVYGKVIQWYDCGMYGTNKTLGKK